MDKITIEFIKEDGNGFWKGWIVKSGDRYADGLCYEEMIGVIISLTLPENRPCINWMKTKEQHSKDKL